METNVPSEDDRETSMEDTSHMERNAYLTATTSDSEELPEASSEVVSVNFMKGIMSAVVGSAAMVSLLLMTGCLASPQFSVGDCVQLQDRVFDSDMKSASCADAEGTFDPAERIYRVDSIIDNTDGGCPEFAGFFPVEFVREPDGVTYCLVQES